MTSGPTVPSSSGIIVIGPVDAQRRGFVGHSFGSTSGRRCGARLSSRPSNASTSKIPGEVVRPVSAARSGCATLPSFTPLRLRDLADRLPRATAASQFASAAKRVVGACEQRPSVRRQQRRCGLVDVERARSEQEVRAVGELVRAYARVPSAQAWRCTSSAFCSARSAELRRDQVGQPLVVGLADIMAVEVLELLEVEARGRFADVVAGRTIRSPARG